MKRFSAQYIITGTGEVLKRGIISTDDNGTITDVTDTGGNLTEQQNTEFYNGIIIPGFVNCHCHLELSAMKGMVPEGRGLAGFVRDINEKRGLPADKIASSIEEADHVMYMSGISVCADICNTGSTFNTKEKSRIEYINLLEIFGVNPILAGERLESIIRLKESASEYSSQTFIVPHSLYSISNTLMSSLKELTAHNRVTSIHFMESPEEKEYLESGTGKIVESYTAMGITEQMISDRVRNHSEAIRSAVTASGNLILVHNTFAGENDVEMVLERGNTYWCLCPSSNLYIENMMPPVSLLRKKGADIVLGTDSLASNGALSILREMKVVSSYHPEIPLTELVTWATINGARALSLENRYGTIEKTKQPGLVLLENISLSSMELTRGVTARRLI